MLRLNAPLKKLGSSDKMLVISPITEIQSSTKENTLSILRKILIPPTMIRSKKRINRDILIHLGISCHLSIATICLLFHLQVFHSILAIFLRRQTVTTSGNHSSMSCYLGNTRLHLTYQSKLIGLYYHIYLQISIYSVKYYEEVSTSVLSQLTPHNGCTVELCKFQRKREREMSLNRLDLAILSAKYFNGSANKVQIFSVSAK